MTGYHLSLLTHTQMVALRSARPLRRHRKRTRTELPHPSGNCARDTTKPLASRRPIQPRSLNTRIHNDSGEDLLETYTRRSDVQLDVRGAT